MTEDITTPVVCYMCEKHATRLVDIIDDDGELEYLDMCEEHFAKHLENLEEEEHEDDDEDDDSCDIDFDQMEIDDDYPS
jgi:hypothetical protein